MILVQWEEVPGVRFGEVLLPTLPVAGQYISFGDVVDDEDQEPVEFRVHRAAWSCEGGIIEGHIIVSAGEGI